MSVVVGSGWNATASNLWMSIQHPVPEPDAKASRFSDTMAEPSVTEQQLIKWNPVRPPPPPSSSRTLSKSLRWIDPSTAVAHASPHLLPLHPPVKKTQRNSRNSSNLQRSPAIGRIGHRSRRSFIACNEKRWRWHQMLADAGSGRSRTGPRVHPPPLLVVLPRIEGTRGYIAPEVLAGGRTSTGRQSTCNEHMSQAQATTTIREPHAARAQATAEATSTHD